jgi:DNA-binding beta-propeller fold protein YncE
MNLDGKIIPTGKGAPQGAVLSPDYWNFYIAELGDRIRNVKDGTLNTFRA